jgi:hypothetical protein
MVELIRISEPVLISALKAALAGARIEVFEFDGPIADIYPTAGFPRRLMVHDDDLEAARELIAALWPEHLPPLPASSDD